jgi:hypothetical protein
MATKQRKKQMNTKGNINNTGIKFAISNFKLEHGLYLNPDLRRVWTIARDDIAQLENINPKAADKDSIWHLNAYRSFTAARMVFEELTCMHSNDVYDAFMVAAKRYHKVA